MRTIKSIILKKRMALKLECVFISCISRKVEKDGKKWIFNEGYVLNDKHLQAVQFGEQCPTSKMGDNLILNGYMKFDEFKKKLIFHVK